MSRDSIWLNLLILSLSLVGFFFLAMASERQGADILKRPPRIQEKTYFRLLGWPILATSWYLCLQAWGMAIGTVACLGWLTVAGTTLNFTLAYINHNTSTKKTSTTTIQHSHSAPQPRIKVWLYATVLTAIPCLFIYTLQTSDVTAVLRADAVSSTIGPWQYRLAEQNQHAPAINATNKASKVFEVRFCQGCQAEIRAAYLAFGSASSAGTARTAFSRRGTAPLSAILPIPALTQEQDQLWLTVEAKDGRVFHERVDIARLSPATATYLQLTTTAAP